MLSQIADEYYPHTIFGSKDKNFSERILRLQSLPIYRILWGGIQTKEDCILIRYVMVA